MLTFTRSMCLTFVCFDRSNVRRPGRTVTANAAEHRVLDEVFVAPHSVVKHTCVWSPVADGLYLVLDPL